MTENPKLLQAIREVFDERFEIELKELESEPPHIFSEKHNKKMAKLIRDQKKPYFRLICTAGRRAACIAVAVIVIFASSLSVKAVREAVYNFVTSIFSDHTVVTTESGTDVGYPETIEQEYYISELPEGFEITDHVHNGLMTKTDYLNNNKYILFSQHTKKYFSVAYDNENEKFGEYYSDSGQKYLIITTEHDSTYIWDNGNYIFTIASNLDRDEIIKLCESTKIK